MPDQESASQKPREENSLQGGPVSPRRRHRGVDSPIEETFWSAKEWSERTRVPYRTILAATARGELEAVRPSGTPHGVVLIAESSWSAWISASRLRRRSIGRVDLRRLPDSRNLSDLRLS